MHLFVDSADPAAFIAALARGFVYGVTTNPTLLRRATMSAGAVPKLVEQALEHGAQEIQLQVYAEDQAGMVREGILLHQLAPERIVIKIPATPEGFVAAAELTRQKIRVTLTAVYTVQQALLAQSVGASYIAVYLGRMHDAGIDSLAIVGQMQALFHAQHANVQILAASIRSPAEVEALGVLGVGAATLPPPLLEQLPLSPHTELAAATFSEDAAAIQ